MRRYRKKKNKQRKIIIISMCSLLFFITVGYAAMSTNLEIKAKGNIIKKNNIGNELINKAGVVTSGDGLYKDVYEEDRYIYKEDRYIYKGINPNNYILFSNEELWRIISIEKNGSLKIIKNEILTSMAWDYDGSNDWETSDIKAYLNGEYYNSLNSAIKNIIVPYEWSIGNVELRNNDLATQIINENMIRSKPANIGLISVSDYLRANSNDQCNTLSKYNYNTDVCKETDWLLHDYWMISPSENGNYVFFVLWTGKLGSTYSDFDAIAPRPAAYLSSELTISSGNGSFEQPYTLSL